MRRVFFLSLIAYGLITTGLATHNGAVLTLALPVALFLLRGLIQHQTQLDLTVTRQLSAQRVGPDSPVEITITVHNSGTARNEVVFSDPLPQTLEVTKGSPRHLLQLNPGETVTYNYTIRGKRGYYRFDQIQVSTRNASGLIQRKISLPTDGQLLILPPVLKLKHVSIRPRRTRVYSGDIPARVGGLGVEFFGVREFQTGDSPGWINWRVSARHSERLYANEFEQDRVADVGIILDGRVRSNIIAEGRSIFEFSVQAAATLANAFLIQGHRVGLLHYGEYLRWTIPGYGKLQRERILRELTQVEPGDSLVFSYLQYLPTQLFPPQSQIVLISPLTPDDPEVLLQLRARGFQVQVISPDPVAFELAGLPAQSEMKIAGRIIHLERNIFLQSLLQGGINVINWDVSEPLDQVAHSLSRTPARLRSIIKAA